MYLSVAGWKCATLSVKYVNPKLEELFYLVCKILVYAVLTIHQRYCRMGDLN